MVNITIMLFKPLRDHTCFMIWDTATAARKTDALWDESWKPLLDLTELEHENKLELASDHC